MDTLTKSCSPTSVITANGEIQTHEEATVYVKELDILWKTRQQDCRLESFAMKTDTPMNGPTVKNHISLETAFGYSANTELRSHRVSRLVSEFVIRFLSVDFKDTFKAGEALFYIFFKLVVVTDSNIK